MYYNNSTFRACIFVIICLFAVSPNALAKKALEDADSVKKGSIEGRVVSVSSDKISIVYKEDKETRTEWEMNIPLDLENLAFSGVQSLNGIKVGDTIKVDFNEYEEDVLLVDKQGQPQAGKKVIGRKGAKIKMIKTATTGHGGGKGSLKSN